MRVRRQSAMAANKLLVRGCEVILGCFALALVLMVLLQVGGRIAGAQFAWTEELTRYILCWLTCLGLPVLTSRRNNQVSPRPSLRQTDSAHRALSTLLMLLVCIVLFWWGIRLAVNAADQMMIAVRLPMAVAYAGIPAGALITIILGVMAQGAVTQ